MLIGFVFVYKNNGLEFVEQIRSLLFVFVNKNKGGGENRLRLSTFLNSKTKRQRISEERALSNIQKRESSPSQFVFVVHYKYKLRGRESSLLKKSSFDMLEPYAVKAARTVLKGGNSEKKDLS